MKIGRLSGTGGCYCKGNDTKNISSLLSVRRSAARIEEVMYSEEIYFAMVQEKVVGTGSIQKNDICRLFILPEY